MTWTDPTTRSTGDLITAAVWNADLVDNLDFLHDRVVDRWLLPTPISSPWVLAGDMATVSLLVANYYAFFTFDVPDDFDALEHLKVVLIPAATGTFQYDLDSDYGAEGEAYNTHSESLANQQASVTLNALTLLDVSGVFSSMAAGDICGLKIKQDSGQVYCVALWMRYTRA